MRRKDEPQTTRKIRRAEAVKKRRAERKKLPEKYAAEREAARLEEQRRQEQDVESVPEEATVAPPKHPRLLWLLPVIATAEMTLGEAPSRRTKR